MWTNREHPNMFLLLQRERLLQRPWPFSLARARRRFHPHATVSSGTFAQRWVTLCRVHLQASHGEDVWIKNNQNSLRYLCKIQISFWISLNVYYYRNSNKSASMNFNQTVRLKTLFRAFLAFFISFGCLNRC